MRLARRGHNKRATQARITEPLPAETESSNKARGAHSRAALPGWLLAWLPRLSRLPRDRKDRRRTEEEARRERASASSTRISDMWEEASERVWHRASSWASCWSSTAEAPGAAAAAAACAASQALGLARASRAWSAAACLAPACAAASSAAAAAWAAASWLSKDAAECCRPPVGAASWAWGEARGEEARGEEEELDRRWQLRLRLGVCEGVALPAPLGESAGMAIHGRDTE